MAVFSSASAQDEWVVVDSVIIKGNSHTRTSVIERELNFQKGDTLEVASLEELFRWNRFQLLNTSLFGEVRIYSAFWLIPDNRIYVQVDVTENWYLYPIPILELADRNFNVWWEEFDRSLDRLNLGIRLTHTNFSGRRDYLKVIAQLGYTRNYGIEYSVPFVNQDQSLGVTLEVKYRRNREVQYNTVSDQQLFYRNEEAFVLDRFNTGITLHYRPGFQVYHDFMAGFHQNDIGGVVRDSNPDFFLSGRTRQRYFTFRYRLAIDKRDIKPYPTKGSFFELFVRKNGLGFFDDVDMLYVAPEYAHYLPLGPKLIMENGFMARYSLIREKQPYFNSRALGFGDRFVRGYEFYLMDGLDYLLSRNSLHLELFNDRIRFGNWVFIPAFRKMPLKAYLSLNLDAGWSNNPHYGAGNPLSNTLLIGGGPAIDLVFFYNKVFRLEYSFNRLSESGFFIHTELGF